MDNIIGPIICGGVGGSGTRILAQLLEKMDIFMGEDLNQSKDLLLMGKLLPGLRRILNDSNMLGASDVTEFVNKSLFDVQEIMLGGVSEYHKGWGWKVPPNFFLIEYFNDVFENAKYIHVIRHGLDMAYSENNNQLRNWGFFFGITPSEFELRKNKNTLMLKYWIAANNYAIANANKYMGSNFLLIKFEDICFSPEKIINDLCDFLSISIAGEMRKDLCQIIKPPRTVGRYKKYDVSCFDESDVVEVKKLGFDV